MLLALAREYDNGNLHYSELLALDEALLSFPWQSDQYVCEIGTIHGITAAFLGCLVGAAGLPYIVASIDSFEIATNQAIQIYKDPLGLPDLFLHLPNYR